MTETSSLAGRRASSGRRAFCFRHVSGEELMVSLGRDIHSDCRYTSLGGQYLLSCHNIRPTFEAIVKNERARRKITGNMRVAEAF